MFYRNRRGFKERRTGCIPLLQFSKSMVLGDIRGVIKKFVDRCDEINTY